MLIILYYTNDMKYLLRGIARGTAFFFGCFSLINTLVSQFGSSRLEDIWWIDLSFLPAPVATLLSICLAFALVAFAIKPHMRNGRKYYTTGITSIYAFVALLNAAAYYRALSLGEFSTQAPLPFSLIMCVIFIVIAASVFFMHTYASKPAEYAVAFLIVLLWLVLFPLAQIELFGRTNYESKSDMAVVFGARVYPDGTISATVRDRMDTALDLYKRGLVKKILITGGVDADGVDETQGMLKYGISQGVPRSAFVLDNKGDNTDESVKNTTQYFREHKIGKVLAVSKYYHLPRIKMAYRAEHFNVRTVPAFEPLPITGESYTVMRELPAFWVYWLRSGLRDVGGLSALLQKFSL